MTLSNSPRITVWFNAGLTAILALFLLACAFAHPIADDFDFASNTRDWGFVNAWRQQYETWNGRYASNALALATPLAFGSLNGYRISLALLMLATACASYVFVRVIGAGALTRPEALAAALTLIALYLLQMPSAGEGVYWYTSAVTYQAAIVVALLDLTCIVRYCRTRSPLWLIVSCVLTAATIGFNEVAMLTMLVIFSGLFAWGLSRAAPLRVGFGLLLAVTLVFTALVLLSPGNAAREAVYPARHQLVRSVAMTALQTVRFLADWVSSGALLLASVLFVPMAAAVVARRSLDPRQLGRYLKLCLIGLALVVPLSVFPAYWATGILGQHRTVNAAYFAFLMLWFGAVGLWAMSGSARAKTVEALGRDLRVPLALLLLLALALTRNSYALGFDVIGGRLAAFDREMRGRDAALRACRDERRPACAIPAIQTRPASFLVLDVSADPHDWINVAHARYFGVPEVRLARSVSEEPEHAPSGDPTGHVRH